MHLKIKPQTKILSLITIIILAFSPIFMAQAATTSTTQTQTQTVQLTTTSEYTNYVTSFVNAEGNCTYVEKPMFPVEINNSQIPIGENWTIICPLQAGLNYHVYFYGAYINTSNTGALTDYDIYVYDPLGNLESIHTQSAGLPEHLGTTVNDPLFTPTESGNYSFVISNNPVDSRGSQEATFMIIQDLQCDQWYTSYVEGAVNDEATFYTNWAYEFETNASYVQLFVNVPDTLDMYEARLYLMNNAASPTLDNFPLAWEPGLYGNLSGSVGGYNFEPEDYRGAAFASCEYPGQSMFLNFTSPNSGPNLYQLVLIGENGSGNVQLMLKDNFENASLTLSPITVFPDTPTELTFSSNDTSTLETAQLTYTTNNWNTNNTINMNISNQICDATIPGQPAGTTVQYQLDATDMLENNLYASGNYTVESASLAPLTAVPTEVYPNIPIDLDFTSNGSKLNTAQLSYTTDNWSNIDTVNMDISNQTCNATIPGQPAGTTIQYQINATDLLENGLNASGNYTVKEPLTLEITSDKSKIRIGENITVSGVLTPNYSEYAAALNPNDSVAVNTQNSTDSKAKAKSNATNSSATQNYSDLMGVPNYNDSIGEVQFSSVDSSQTVDCTVSSNGTFVATFQPDTTGPWIITATSPETQTSYSCYSQQLTVTVTPQPFYVKYSLFIIVGLVDAMAAGAVVYILKFRNRY